MPELAEVEYYRRCWNCGIGERILEIKLHPRKRIFRGIRLPALRRSLWNSVLLRSEARGKQMLFCFTKGLWLGLHLGMTGKLRVEKPCFSPGKHDHLVLCQKHRALVFSDVRLFGRVLFHDGVSEPEWWSNLAPSLTSNAFTLVRLERFLHRHGKLPLKAALLRQDGFPGVGNWMADEILWRARMHPLKPCGAIPPAQRRTLWKVIRFVCSGAMQHISKDFADPPRGWFFHRRWETGGRCPIHRVQLMRGTIGGRTTAWCPTCQGR